MLKYCCFTFLFFLFSCTLGEDYQHSDFWTDKEIAQNLQVENNNSLPSVFWYHIFGDENLNFLVEQALESSLDIKIISAKLQQARYAFDIRRADVLPMLDINSSYNYAYAPRYAEFGDRDSYFKLGFDASWELDVFGKGRRTKESYLAMYYAAINNLDNAKLSLTAEVALDYAGLRVAQAQLKNARENLQLQREIRNLVRDKYNAGIADNIALNQAEYALNSTQSLLPQYENQIKVYQNALLVLMGKLPADMKILDITKNNIAERNFKFDLRTLREIPIQSLRRRPDVMAAENMLIAKNAEVGVALASMFPDVSIGASLGRQGHLLKDLSHSYNAAYGYVPQVDLPFFHWGQLYNQLKSAKAVKEEYLYEYQKILLQALQEVSNAINAVEKEYEKNAALKKAVVNMQKVMESMKEKYTQGLLNFSDLLDTEQKLLQAQSQLIESRGDIYEKVIAFYKAIGGGY